MRRKPFKTIGSCIFLSLFSTLLLASPPEEVKKVYHKSYPANEKTVLSIENKYGDVNVINWKKDSIIVDVVVTIDYPGTFKGKDLIEYITVGFSVSGNTIQAVTNIDEHFIDKWYRRDDRKKFRIDYTVHAPSYLNLRLLNKYGDVHINELSGRVELEVRYGYIKIHNLTRGNRKPLNSLMLAYSKGTIDDAGWLMLEMKYSKLEIGKCIALAGETKYSKLQVGQASSLVFESKYDTYDLGPLNNLVLVASYGNGSIKVDEVRKKLSLETRYSSVEVDRIPAGFSSIDINNAYGTIKLRIDPDASYSLKGSTSYCKLSYPNIQLVNRIVKNNSAEVSGFVGNDKSSKSKVSVISKYGSVYLH